MKDKLAQEIIKAFIEKLDHSYVYKTQNERENVILELRKIVQDYHEAKLKEELTNFHLWIDKNFAIGHLTNKVDEVVDEFLLYQNEIASCNRKRS